MTYVPLLSCVRLVPADVSWSLICVLLLVIVIKRRSVEKDPLNTFNRMARCASGGTFYVYRT